MSNIGPMSEEGFDRLQQDEAYSQYVYWDLTGQKIRHDRFNGDPTVGYGRNLYTRGLTIAEATYLLMNDIKLSASKIDKSITNGLTLPQLWLDVLIMIDYNTGNVLGWPALIKAVYDGSRDAIAAAIRDSDAWRGLEKARYERFAVAITKGTWS